MKRRIVCFSAHSANLRATAFTRFLRACGYEIIEPKLHGAPGTILELGLTLLPNCWLALTVRADLAAGFKPHPNVTLPLLICKLRGLPTWIDVDDLDHAYREGWISRLVEWLQRPFPRLCTVVSYHNLLLRDYLIQHMHCAPNRLLRIQQGVDFGFFNRPHHAPKPVAIYAAHLNVACDLAEVLQAWQIVTGRLPAARLIILGGGPLLAHFQKLAAGMNVEFTGEIAHADVPARFVAAQVALLYMSDRMVNAYRCSLKLREYFAAGIKVVCNDFGELHEYADLTYQTQSSVTDFADMIVRVLEGHDDQRQLAAQRFAAEHLDWPRLITTAAGELAHRVELAPPKQIG